MPDIINALQTMAPNSNTARARKPTGGQPITKGTAMVVASYDRTSERYSNIRAARDAEIRDAKQLSDQIRLRLAAALATRGS